MDLTIMQYFEWHSPDDGEHWNHLSKEAAKIKGQGFDAVWLPPPTKADHPSNPGYAAYDVYDLGEFDQKGSVRTKYGTKEQLQNAINACRETGLLVYLDLVMNHKAGGDEKETFKVVEVKEDDREEEIREPFDIEGYTYFDFPGRQGKHSDFKWNFNLFTGVDYDAKEERNGIFRIMGEDKDWSDNVDAEHGNYDYLMYADINYAHPEVQEEMIRWGKWLSDELDADGYRIDAAKHIDSNFIKRFIDEVAEHAGRDIYFFGEYWNPSLEANEDFLDDVSFDIDVFDVRLHYNFYTAGLEKETYNLTQIFDGSMVAENPSNAVTFVDNHDTQPGESLESFVADWFKQPAYSLILLRQDGYPCVFYGDYHGISGDHKVDGKRDEIDVLLDIRKKLAHGNQKDYFDHPDTIGWIRFGGEHTTGSGCAVVISNGLEEGFKKMHVGEIRTGEKWVDHTGNRADEITIDEEGNGVFYADSQSVSVYGKKMD